jgi:hypothetical protein
MSTAVLKPSHLVLSIAITIFDKMGKLSKGEEAAYKAKIKPKAAVPTLSRIVCPQRS